MTKNLGKVDEEKEGRHHEATHKTSWKLNILWARVTVLTMWVHFLTLRLPPLPSRGNKIETDLQDTYGIIGDSEHRFVKCFKQKHMHAYTFNIYVDTGAWFREKITSCASIIFPIVPNTADTPILQWYPWLPWSSDSSLLTGVQWRGYVQMANIFWGHVIEQKQRWNRGHKSTGNSAWWQNGDLVTLVTQTKTLSGQGQSLRVSLTTSGRL